MTDKELLDEYVSEHDRILGTCDAYDVKASIWLAVIIFLAVQTGDLLGKSLPQGLMYAQWLSAILLVVAGVSTLIELYPRDYQRYTPSNGVIERWLPKLREVYKDDPNGQAVVCKKTVEYRLAWFKEMIADNRKLNHTKASWLLAVLLDCGSSGGGELTYTSYPPPLFSGSIGLPSGSGSGVLFGSSRMTFSVIQYALKSP